MQIVSNGGKKNKKNIINLWSAELAKKVLTHHSLETPKRLIGKHCRPRSDTTECGIWSGSPLFANSLAIFL